MRSRLLFLLSSLFCFQCMHSQLRIDDCYEKAEKNYPLIKQYNLIEKSKEFNLSNAGKGYLPQIQLSAKATYQSEVTKIPIDFPGIKSLNKDQYGATVDINQVIWDGGNISAAKERIKAKSEVDNKNLEVTLYTLRDRVNQLFFGILLHDAMLNQNKLYQKELQRNYDQVSAYITNGVANQSDLVAVRLEQTKAIQQQTEFTHNRSSYLAMLSALIGETLPEKTSLETPNVYQVNSNSIQRPELMLFDAQQKNLEAQRKSINSNAMPLLSTFITGGYGRPGLNMLENKFSAYYIGGIRMTWNISSLYSRKNSLKNIEINEDLIVSQREAFLFNTNLDIINSNNNIKKIQELIQTDDEIIRLRSSIKSSSEIKTANGTLSVLDLMKEVNAEQMAKQDKIIHQIQLIQAIYNLKYITNN